MNGAAVVTGARPVAANLRDTASAELCPASAAELHSRHELSATLGARCGLHAWLHAARTELECAELVTPCPPTELRSSGRTQSSTSSDSLQRGPMTLPPSSEHRTAVAHPRRAENWARRALA